MPTSSRPPERMSSTAARSAMLIGWLNSGTQMMMPWPTRIFLVCMAQAVRNSSGGGAVRVLLEEVVLDRPHLVEAELVGQAHLIQRVSRRRVRISSRLLATRPRRAGHIDSMGVRPPGANPAEIAPSGPGSSCICRADVNFLQCPVRRLGRSSQSYLFWRGSHMRILVSCTAVAALGAAVIGPAAATEARSFRASEQFERVATFVVCENTSCDRTKVPLTAAEIVAASEDGRTLVYSDSPNQSLGFVDISKPGQPKALGALSLKGLQVGAKASPPPSPWPASGYWWWWTRPPASRRRPVTWPCSVSTHAPRTWRPARRARSFLSSANPMRWR